MLVPGINGVFNVYDCSKDAYKKCEPEVLNKKDQRLSGESWALSLGLAVGVLVIHFLGRLIHLPKEFKVSEKKIQKDLKRLAEREEEKAKKEQERLRKEVQFLKRRETGEV